MTRERDFLFSTKTGQYRAAAILLYFVRAPMRCPHCGAVASLRADPKLKVKT